MPTAQTAPGLLPRPASDPPLTRDMRLSGTVPATGLLLAQEVELPGDLRFTGESGPAEHDTTPPEAAKAGCWNRARGGGGGFAAGVVADDLPPGPVLAGFAAGTWATGPGRLSDDELIGVLRASRRLASWAAAMELACVAELWRRRTAEEDAGDTWAAEHAEDEIAAALTLTSRAADGVLDLAIALQRLPATRAALAAGAIDLPRAKVIADEVTGLTDEHAAAVDQAIARSAPGQTTGQLRAAARRAVIAADPAAARRRKEQALREARVERWDESAGTSALAGRDLPPVSVLAADHNLTALATQLKNAGVAGTLDTLRARVYLALLTGAPVSSLLASGYGTPANSADGSPPSGDPGDPGPGIGRPGDGAATTGPPPAACLTGSVNLTVPLATWLGGSTEPGHAAGYGLLDAGDSRDLAGTLAAGSGGRWCITFTGPDGRPVAHGCARSGPPAGLRRSQPEGRPRPGPGTRSRDGTWTFTVTPLGTVCNHASQTPGYRPSAALRHLFEIRQPTCSHPGCRRPAASCDLDHTVAYHRGGRTCLCNLAPLCRRHHRAKQAPGWHLVQDQPGQMTWRLPSGRSYATCAEPYPV